MTQQWLLTYFHEMTQQWLLTYSHEMTQQWLLTYFHEMTQQWLLTYFHEMTQRWQLTYFHEMTQQWLLTYSHEMTQQWLLTYSHEMTQQWLLPLQVWRSCGTWWGEARWSSWWRPVAVLTSRWSARPWRTASPVSWRLTSRRSRKSWTVWWRGFLTWVSPGDCVVICCCYMSSSSSSSVFPCNISGVHHFWVRFLRMWPFFNPTIKVVTFRLHGWCVLSVFLLPAFTRLEHKRQELLSPCNKMHVCTD